MVHGLDYLQWEDSLGLKRVDWADALDEDAYRTGLRMTGAPKATKCNCEKNGIECPFATTRTRTTSSIHASTSSARVWGTIENGFIETFARERNPSGEETSVRCTDESTPRIEPTVYANSHARRTPLRSEESRKVHRRATTPSFVAKTIGASQRGCQERHALPSEEA